MARLFALVALALVACTNAFVAPATSVVATQQRAAAVSMFGGSKKAAPKAAKGAKVAKKAAPKKAAPKKAAPKKAVAKKAAPKPVAKKAPPKKTSARGKSPVGKGGILPWVTNAPGSKRTLHLPLPPTASLSLARVACREVLICAPSLASLRSLRQAAHALLG